MLWNDVCKMLCSILCLVTYLMCTATKDFPSPASPSATPVHPTLRGNIQVNFKYLSDIILLLNAYLLASFYMGVVDSLTPPNSMCEIN